MTELKRREPEIPIPDTTQPRHNHTTSHHVPPSLTSIRQILTTDPSQQTQMTRRVRLAKLVVSILWLRRSFRILEVGALGAWAPRAAVGWHEIP